MGREREREIFISSAGESMVKPVLIHCWRQYRQSLFVKNLEIYPRSVKILIPFDLRIPSVKNKVCIHFFITLNKLLTSLSIDKRAFKKKSHQVRSVGYYVSFKNYGFVLARWLGRGVILYTKRLQVQSLFGVHVGGSQSMFLTLIFFSSSLSTKSTLIPR